MRWRWILLSAAAIVAAAYLGSLPSPRPPLPPLPPPPAPEASPPPRPIWPVAQPDSPPLRPLITDRLVPRVERLRRCRGGDALLTIEEGPRGGDPRVVVRRRGQPCFRISFLFRRELALDALEAGPTWTRSGEPGPLALVATLPLSEPPDDLFAPHEKDFEKRLVVVSWTGELLLDRGLRSRSFRAGPWRGESVELRPLLWDRDWLHVWVSSRGFHGEATQCVGSLLQVPAKGAMEVVEGLPCEAVSLLDADGDGNLEIRAASSRADHRDAPWQGVVRTDGALLASLALPWEETLLLARDGGPSLLFFSDAGPRLAPWPWNAGTIALQPAEAPPFAADLDGDGGEELLLAEAGETRVHDGSDGRLLYRVPGVVLATLRGPSGDRALVADRACGLAAVGGTGARSCAPPALAGHWPLDGQVGAFDWSGDASTEPLLLRADADGRWLAARWSDGGAHLRAAAGIASLLPLHTDRRVLDLAPLRRPAILFAQEEDFVVIDAWSGEERLLLSRRDGVLRALAIPVEGPRMGAERVLPPRWGRL